MGAYCKLRGLRTLPLKRGIMQSMVALTLWTENELYHMGFDADDIAFAVLTRQPPYYFNCRHHFEPVSIGGDV